MNSKIFYKPDDGWVGDVIPYCENGVFYLFYLFERRESPRKGMSWRLVITKDFIHFDDRGIQLVHGTVNDPDFNAYTGSVVKDKTGKYHLFYTGQNPNHCGDNGLPVQLVMHAISSDGMQTWKKVSADTFGANKDYETSDWRDPFVLWDEESNLWRLLVAAREQTGPERRRGVVAQCVSTDLKNWKSVKPLWNPRRYITQECPDVFFWKNWWYLIYSEFSDSFATRYRMSHSLEGPWRVPASGEDSIDGRAFYAAKTAEWDGRRFFFGWIPSRVGSSDDGDWQWAGTLSILEGVQRHDGSLSFVIPKEILSIFTKMIWCLSSTDKFEIGRADGYECQLLPVASADAFRVHFCFEITEDMADTGVLLHASSDGNYSHILRLEPRRGRMVVDRWPRKKKGDEQWQISGDVPFALELERPCHLIPGKHELDIVVEDDICVANIDRKVVLSTRMETTWGNYIGIFSNDGVTRFNEIAIFNKDSSIYEENRSLKNIPGEGEKIANSYQ